MRELQKESAVDLRIFLNDVLGDSTFLKRTNNVHKEVKNCYDWQYKKPVLCFKKYELNGLDLTGLVQQGAMNTVFTCSEYHADRLFNLYFQVNTGNIKFLNKPFGHYVEGRKKIDIVSHNAFMLDFDLKDENKKSYKGQQLIDEKEKLFNKIWTGLPLEPDYIVESRNGYHIYYLIPTKDRTIMTSLDWHWVEWGIFAYVKSNISECVDSAVKKIIN